MIPCTDCFGSILRKFAKEHLLLQHIYTFGTRNGKSYAKIMQRRGVALLLKILAAFALLFSGSCNGGELSESQLLHSFISAVDPKNVMGIQWNLSLPHPCSNQWLGVRCKMRVPSITEIRLENLNLSGVLDAESLCKLPNLRVLILADNHIRGTIPGTIANCRSLVHLDIRGNFLRGSLPVDLTKMRNLRRLDVSKNCFSSVSPRLMRESELPRKCRIKFDTSRRNTVHKVADLVDASAPSPHELPSSMRSSEDRNGHTSWVTWTPFAVGMALFLLLSLFLNLRAVQAAKCGNIVGALAPAAVKTDPPKVLEEEKREEKCSELVFFVEEKERFALEDLLEAAADLVNQNFCSSLYKVQLKNNAIIAVKRLKKLQVSYEEFGETMRKIGNLKHQNILPLIGYNSISTNDEKLFIYGYQKNGSLLTLMENYIQGKRNFPWKHRLSIAVGIARGLDFIYQRADDEEIIPHGNIKLSNILLNENEEPLISEYGYSKFLNPIPASLFAFTGYTAPEKSLSEQGDIYSYGVILLELLTGKIVETSGLDLPRWVKARVSEEWTGEVFDKEIEKVEMYGFSLLNISLKCVSVSPQERPSISEVLEKIEEIVNDEQEFTSFSNISSVSDQQDCCGLASRSTPGSNQ